jgi:hypothetical protein
MFTLSIENAITDYPTWKIPAPRPDRLVAAWPDRLAASTDLGFATRMTTPAPSPSYRTADILRIRWAAPPRRARPKSTPR